MCLRRDQSQAPSFASVEPFIRLGVIQVVLSNVHRLLDFAQLAINGFEVGGVFEIISLHRPGTTRHKDARYPSLTKSPQIRHIFAFQKVVR